MALYAVAGLPTKIELPVPLIQDIIPLSQWRQRPGIPRELPGFWVQHETANSNVGADAAMHNRWLQNGADGSQVSFHFCVDDHQIYQMIPVDEVTWQAADGGGPGNMSGVSCEACVNADGNETVMRRNAEALAAGLMGALGLGIDRCKRHYDFNAADPNRHYCPQHMMTSGYWPLFVAHVDALLGGTGGTGMQYPEGWDAGIAAQVWVSIVGEKYPEYRFNEKGIVSKIWITNPSPLVYHFKDSSSGREFFTFSNGDVIGRYASNESFRLLDVAA
jgi:hypothetical protein